VGRRNGVEMRIHCERGVVESERRLVEEATADETEMATEEEMAV
jgi:hypothetical protein